MKGNALPRVREPRREPIWEGGVDAMTHLYKVAMEGKRPPIPETATHAVRQLMIRCWCQQPESRPSAAEVMTELQALVACSPAPSPGTRSLAMRVAADNSKRTRAPPHLPDSMTRELAAALCASATRVFAGPMRPCARGRCRDERGRGGNNAAHRQCAHAHHSSLGRP